MPIILNSDFSDLEKRVMADTTGITCVIAADTHSISGSIKTLGGSTSHAKLMPIFLERIGYEPWMDVYLSVSNKIYRVQVLSKTVCLSKDLLVCVNYLLRHRNLPIKSEYKNDNW